jgi:hypothetical protein
MDAKLTLSLEAAVIDKAKQYAKSHKTSLSKMVEAYLTEIVEEEKADKHKITPIVKSLSGIINLDKQTNAAESYTDYLINKYK